jgi:hypothetical protein
MRCYRGPQEGVLYTWSVFSQLLLETKPVSQPVLSYGKKPGTNAKPCARVGVTAPVAEGWGEDITINHKAT